jgi:soluble lytic murein transglycosylase-like protein
MLTKLDKSTFIREAHALPPPQPPVHIAMAKLAQTPDYWYANLGCKELERIYGLPSGILKHMIEKESAGNPRAKSPAGARGLFQIMPADISGFHGDPFNPLEAAHYAAKTLNNLAKHFTSWSEVLAAYNWGRGNVHRHGLHKAPKETRNYIKFFHQKGVPVGKIRNSVNDVNTFNAKV